MSNLKHLSLKQLQEAKRHSEQKIGKLTGRINNENTRLIWINKYIADKQAPLLTKEDFKPINFGIVEATIDNVGFIFQNPARDGRRAKSEPLLLIGAGIKDFSTQRVIDLDDALIKSNEWLQNRFENKPGE